MKPLFLTTVLSLSTSVAIGCGSDTGDNSATGGNAGSSTGGGTSTSSGGSSSAGGQQATGGATSSSTKKVPGETCTADNQCTGLTSLDGVCMASWPGGGYCTTSECVNSVNCANNGRCSDDGNGTLRCLQYCFDSTSCRAGYTCVGSGCVPST
jgi:hypothetical protein